MRPVADACRSRTDARRRRARDRGLRRAAGAARRHDRRRAAHGLRDGRLPRVRDRHERRQRARLPRGPGARPRLRAVQRGRARDRRRPLMPWRRPRKPVERAVNVSRSVEESLEEIARGDEDDDTVELADVDGASITEAATGEPDDGRTPSELGAKLSAALVSGSAGAPPKPSTRSGVPPSVGRDPTARGPAAAQPAEPSTLAEFGVDLAVDAARGLRLRNPVLTASGTFGQGVEYAELFDVARLGAIVNKGTTRDPRLGNPQRSEERRVGKECRARGSP